MKHFILAATFVLAGTALANAQSWAPLSGEEIAAARTCFIGGQIAICAGDKQIATGILIIPSLLGVTMLGGREKDYLDTAAEGSMFSVTAQSTLRQTPESGKPEWQRSYYVISDKQLANIIEKARHEPEWKP